jgi:hypothetical protein
MEKGSRLYGIEDENDKDFILGFTDNKEESEGVKRNRVAKESVIVTPSPFSEATCCKSILEERSTFWEKKGLPPLPELYVAKRPFARQTWEVTPFLPKSLTLMDATPPVELSFQIFLKLCYKGERIGLPHELGYDHTCDWCGIVLPTFACSLTLSRLSLIAACSPIHSALCAVWPR